MVRIISIPIEFHNKEYYALIRVHNAGECKELKVTIMNGELERLLYGNNVFKHKDGALLVDVTDDVSEAAKLKLAILKALSEYLVRNPLTEHSSLQSD